MYRIKNPLNRLFQKNTLLRCLYKILKNRKNESFIERVLTTEFEPEVLILGNDKLKRGDEKCYLLIDLRGKDVGTRGLCAILRYALAGCYIAERVGVIPYINIEDSLYNVPGGFYGCNNMYNYYFESSGESKEDIIKNKNYIVFRTRNIDLVYNSFTDEYNEAVVSGYRVTDSYLREMGKMMQKYIHLKHEIKEQFMTQIQELFQNRKVLGIHIRGTDFMAGLEKHPVAIGPASYYEYIDTALQMGFEAIFVATDDEVILEEMLRRYTHRVIFYQDTYRSQNGIALHMQKLERENNGYYLGWEVLRDVYTLAACNGLVSGLSQVSFYARIVKYAQNEEFDYAVEIDHGMNTQRDKDKLKIYKRKLQEEGIKFNFD